MRRTLVTGVAGFTGRYLAPVLAERGHEIHGIVHARDEAVEGVHRIYEAELSDLGRIRAIVNEVQPDHVVHLAGIAFVGHSEVDEIYRSNVIGTRHLLDALAALARPPRSVLIASSANVYGNAREGELGEETSFAPANDYAVSKVAMEFVSSLFQDRLPLIIVRPFNYTGRGQSTQFVVPKIAAHARQRAATIELGNLEVARDFSDVRSVVRIYGRLLDEHSAVGGTYNVCSGHAVTLQQILEMVSRLSGHQLDVRINPAFVRANEVRILQGAKSKLESVIGPLPSIPIEDTLRWMLDD